MDNTYKDRFIYGTTDAEGMLVDTIPDDAFTIIVDTVIDNVQYDLEVAVSSPRSIVKTYVVTLTDLSVTPMFMISNNVVGDEEVEILNFDPTANIMIIFNQALDTEKSSISLFKIVDGNSYEVNVTATYSDNNKSVVLSPYDGDLAKEQQYALVMNNTVTASSEKAVYSKTITFGTYTFDVISSMMTPKVFQLKSPTTIGQYTSSINFQLTIYYKSSYIEVYGRYDADNEFVKFHSEACNWKDQPNGIIMIYGLNFNSFPFDTTPSNEIFDADNNFELMIRSCVINNGEKVYSSFSDVISISKDKEATL